MTSTARSDDADAGGGLCSQLSARRGLPLIGSAGCYDAILAFELDPPWTSRLVGSRASDADLDSAIVRIAAHAKHVRLLALEPDGDPATSVLWMSKDAGAFSRYARREYRVTRTELPALLEHLAFGGAADIAQDALGEISRRDVLVCTHGARDACCGKFGFPLFRELRQLAAERTATTIRVWRSSHLGGHRFAPTLLDLPSGRMFGRIAAGDAAAILDGGTALLARLGAIYRGRCALPEAAQIVERELWQEAGAAFEQASLSWRVEASPQASRASQESMDAWRVELAASCDDERFRTCAEVARAGVDAVTTPASCGRDPETESPWKMLR